MEEGVVVKDLDSSKGLFLKLEDNEKVLTHA